MSTSTLNETLRRGLREPPALAIALSIALALVARPLPGDGVAKTEGTAVSEGDDAVRSPRECEDKKEGAGVGHRSALAAAGGCVDMVMRA